MIWIPLGFRYRAVYCRLACNHAFFFGVRLEVNAHQIAEGLCRGRYAPADAALLIAPVWGIFYVLLAASTTQRAVVQALDFLVSGGVASDGHGLYLSAHQTFALNNGVLHFYEHIGVAIL